MPGWYFLNNSHYFTGIGYFLSLYLLPHIAVQLIFYAGLKAPFLPFNKHYFSRSITHWAMFWCLLDSSLPQKYAWKMYLLSAFFLSLKTKRAVFNTIKVTHITQIPFLWKCLSCKEKFIDPRRILNIVRFLVDKPKPQTKVPRLCFKVITATVETLLVLGCVLPTF